MATGGRSDAAATDEQQASASDDQQVFYNPSGRYQQLTGKNSAFDLLDPSVFYSDTS